MTAKPFLDAARAQRDELTTSIAALLAQQENRGGQLLASEQRTLDTLTAQSNDLGAKIDDYAAQYEREQRATASAAYEPRAHVGGQDSVYARDSGNSYFRDLALLAVPGNPGFAERERLAEHARTIDKAEADLPVEFRAGVNRVAAGQELRVNPNTTYGQGGEFVPPLWLMADWVAALRAGRPAADRCQVKPLPPGTDVINLPKIATGTATAIQTTQGSGASSVDLTTATVSGAVRTIAGQQDISLQLLEQSPANFDEIVYQDLTADYGRQLDQQILTGSGASGQLLGLLTLSGTNAVTFTQASPTVPLLYGPLGQAAAQVAKQRFLGADTILMHPSHWWWIASALDTQNRPLVEPEGGVGVNTVAVLDPFAAQGMAGSIAGIPVVVDANVPTNLGAGTNQAPILVGRFADFFLYEGAIRLRALPEILSGALQMRLQAYNYMTFIPGRYPVSLSVINGTGCIVPAGY